MKKTLTKKEIVNMLLNQNLEVEDEEELLDLLVDQPIAIDVDKTDKETSTFGAKVSDKITSIAGSWPFIITFMVFLGIWIALNIFVFKNVDPYPFILLNLLLSCLAALQAPIIMMSQNRSAKKDSLRGANDYKTDLKSELILEELHDKIVKLIENQNKILKILDEEKNKNN